MFARRPEIVLAIRLFAILFFLIAANVAARTSRDAFLLEGRYAAALPWLIAATAVILYAVVRLQQLLGKAGSAQALFMLTAVTGGLTYLPFLLLSMTGFDTLCYYTWTEALNSLLAVQFWLLASQALDVRDAKKLFGIIGSGGAIGGLAAGLLLRPLIRQYGAVILIAVSSVTTLLAAILSTGIRTFDEGETGESERQESNWNLRHPYVRILVALLIPATLAATLVDYQFKVVAAAAMPDKNALSAFFSTYHAMVSAATLIFQTVISSFVLTKLGLLLSLLVLPVALLVLSAFVPFLAFGGSAALYPLLYLTSAARLTDQTIKFTINHSAFQLLWLPVPALHKARLKLSLEAVLRNTTAGLAGLGIGALTALLQPALPVLSTLVAGTTGILCVLWVIAAYQARHGYRVYLARSLENRLVDFSTEVLEIQSPEIRQNLRRALASGEEGAVAFGLDVLQTQSLSGWEEDLSSIFPDTTQLIRTRILELALRADELLSRQTVIALAESDDVLRFRAQILAAHRRYPEIRPLLEAQSQDPWYAGAVALGGLVLLEPNAETTGKLEAWLRSDDAELRLSAWRAARLFPECVSETALAAALCERSVKIRLAALQIALQRPVTDLAADILPSLGEAKTFEAARQCLNRLSEAEFVALVERSALPESTPPALINGVCRILGHNGFAQALPWLQKVTALQLPDTYFSAGQAIAAIIARRPKLAQNSIDDLVDDAVRQYGLAAAMKSRILVQGKAKEIVVDWLTRLEQRYIQLACRYVAAAAGMQNVDALFAGGKLKPKSQSRMLELIENTLRPASRARLLLLLERDSGAAAGTMVAAAESEEAGARWLQSGSQWTQTMAVLLCCAPPGNPFAAQNLLQVTHFFPLAAEVLHDLLAGEPDAWQSVILPEQIAGLLEKTAVAGEKHMYPTLEKILLLKSVSMFKDIPVEDISDLIQVSNEREFADGTTLFHKGEQGDQLFIVISGQIRVHRDGHQLAMLHRGDFLGEMALLDDEPRSADATTVGDCKMLSIGRQDFMDVLSSKPEVLKGILRLLSHRLREAIERQAG